MRLLYARYSCRECRNAFRAPDLLGGYAEFVLRSELSDELAYLDANSDEVFDELDGILDGFAELSGQDDLERSGIVQSLFGVTCDPAPDGSLFAIDRRPPCPRCGSRKVTFHGPTDPPELVDLDLRHVTHARWDELPLLAKQEAVRRALAARQLP